jgi:L-ribulose-5-phosphate 3-epimerase
LTRMGIMQGRLVPPLGDRIQCFPRDDWAREFPLASAAGLDCIEWIFDEFGADANPLSTDAGIDAVLALAEEHHVHVSSICADYFMDRPLVRANASELAERTAMLNWLLRRCSRVGADRVVVPFVDASRIDTAEELDGVVAVLRRTLPIAEETGIEIHLESSLEPEQFEGLLDRLPHRLLKVNYDSGNSSSLGYRPRAEFSAYGARVGSVHIKDRVLHGGTVPLGSGDADLPALFGCLKEVGYEDDIILQVARGTSGDEVAWALSNRRIVQHHLAAAGLLGEQS